MTRNGRPLSTDRSAAPYRLRSLMRLYEIPLRALGERLRFTSGRSAGHSMSTASVSLLVTRRIWPTNIDESVIRQTTAELLAEHGVTPKEIETAWIIDGYVDESQAAPSKPRDTRRNANPMPVEAVIDLPEAEMLSPQAKQHFSLPRHPFMDDVQGPQDVYLSKEQRYVRESMFYAAKHGGLVAIIGESGSGKSTLRRDLIERIQRGNETIVLIQPQTIDKTALSAAHICDAIIADLSGERPRQSLEAKGRQIQRILASSSRAGNTHALVIEEAHDLATPTLKYLKRFWELEDGFKRLLGIVLIGQPELSPRLDERRNPDLREFIRRCEVAVLRPLNGNLEEYLTLKFKRVGLELSTLFEPDAFDAIRSRLTRHKPGTGEVESQLYPLVVQNLIVKAMNAAVDLGLPKINAQLVSRI